MPKSIFGPVNKVQNKIICDVTGQNQALVANCYLPQIQLSTIASSD